MLTVGDEFPSYKLQAVTGTDKGKEFETITQDSHPGQWLPFWRQACDDGRSYACPYLADLQTGFCDQGSGWACNESGLLHIALARSGEGHAGGVFAAHPGVQARLSVGGSYRRCF